MCLFGASEVPELLVAVPILLLAAVAAKLYYDRKRRRYREHDHKCEYCDAPAVATAGYPGDYRWCGECQRDLNEFAKIEVPKGMLVDTSNKAAVSRYRAAIQRRQDDFMRKRVKERRPQ